MAIAALYTYSSLPPPSTNFPSTILSTSSILSHAWHREAHLCCSRCRSCLGWEESFSPREAGRRYIRRCQEEREWRACSCCADQGFEMRGVRYVPGCVSDQRA